MRAFPRAVLPLLCWLAAACGEPGRTDRAEGTLLVDPAPPRILGTEAEIPTERDSLEAEVAYLRAPAFADRVAAALSGQPSPELAARLRRAARVALRPDSRLITVSIALDDRDLALRACIQWLRTYVDEIARRDAMSTAGTHASVFDACRRLD